MASIRTKLILYVNITIAIMDMISIVLFFVYPKNNEQKSLEKLGISLVSLVSHDNEVRQALSYAQPALLGHSHPENAVTSTGAVRWPTGVCYMRTAALLKKTHRGFTSTRMKSP